MQAAEFSSKGTDGNYHESSQSASYPSEIVWPNKSSLWHERIGQDDEVFCDKTVSPYPPKEKIKKGGQGSADEAIVIIIRLGS